MDAIWKEALAAVTDAVAGSDYESEIYRWKITTMILDLFLKSKGLKIIL